MSLLRLVSRDVPLSQGFGDLLGLVNLASGMLNRAAVAPAATDVDAFEKISRRWPSVSMRSSTSSTPCSPPTASASRSKPGWRRARATTRSSPIAARNSAPSRPARVARRDRRHHRGTRHRSGASGQGCGRQDPASHRALRCRDRLRYLCHAGDRSGQHGWIGPVRLAVYWPQSGCAAFRVEKTMTRLAGGDLNAEVTSHAAATKSARWPGACGIPRGHRAGQRGSRRTGGRAAGQATSCRDPCHAHQRLRRRRHHHARGGIRRCGPDERRRGAHVIVAAQAKDVPTPLRPRRHRRRPMCRLSRPRPRNSPARSARFLVRCLNHHASHRKQ